jgi:hydroxymethylpyrimidine pyrophosphatase-like HAD family hydrolase
LKTIFSHYLDKAAYVFDYDDTLVGRGNSQPNASQFNDAALNTLVQGAQPQSNLINSQGKNAKVAVCTGNSIRAVKLRRSMFPYFAVTTYTNLRVFADGGVNEYEYTYPTDADSDDEPRPIKFIKCVAPEVSLTEKESENIISRLRSSGIAPAKIENRGNVVISIKPIDTEYRDIITDYINRWVLSGTGVVANKSGRTTIDISKPDVSKKDAVRLVLSELRPEQELVFVGDELLAGNDFAVAQVSAQEDPRVQCLAVTSPTDTALFMIALLRRKLCLICTSSLQVRVQGWVGPFLKHWSHSLTNQI